MLMCLNFNNIAVMSKPRKFKVGNTPAVFNNFRE